jgi:branched-chain amino acid transport system ATP-binding protein
VAPLLELEDVEARYGPVQALHGISLTVGEGEIVAVLGGNGAGKTTTLRAVSGMVSKSGAVRFAGERITRGSPERVARIGIAHVPEGRGIFGELSVWENLRLGAYARGNGFDEGFDRARGHFPWLEQRRDQQAGTLSGGEQQMLALARALMSQPRLLLLDEPSLGLAPKVVREIFEILGELNEKDGLAVLVVEQNAKLALRSSSRAYVLEVGRVALEGPSAELAENDSVRRAYLGY